MTELAENMDGYLLTTKKHFVQQLRELIYEIYLINNF